MKIALASPPFPRSINNGLYWVEKLVQEAAKQHAEIICFPESYIPGYHAAGFEAETPSPARLQEALNKACSIARDNAIAIILPMDWEAADGLLNVAYVISAMGEVLGYQTKNQLDPSEDTIWMPGNERHIFEVNGVKFGIVICHEGFRYPETVRWAASRGAKIVFHPQFTGSDEKGVILSEWGHKDNPYYEKAIMMRALENTIYFASVNYATRFAESGSALIAPDGKCMVHEAYGRAGVVVADVDVAQATGLLAQRYKKELYV